MRLTVVSLAAALILTAGACSKQEEPEQPKSSVSTQPGPNMTPPQETGANVPPPAPQPPRSGADPEDKPTNIRGEEQPVYTDPTESGG
jgi:hypothetical protein